MSGFPEQRFAAGDFMRSAVDSIGVASKVGEIWWTRSGGHDAVRAAATQRFAELVRFTRAHSPFYRRALHGLPNRPALHELPVVTKRELMANFDDWATDRRIERNAVEAFLADRSHIGDDFLARYVVWKSSGSTGEPGIYVQDEDALAVYDTLIAVQLARPDLASQCMSGFLAHGGRAALIAATGDHFASIASWERVCRAAPGLAARGYSIMAPIETLVDDLNAFAPAFVASYPTMLALLAEARAAGRLTIAPALVWSGGETLSAPAHRALQTAFGCPVVNEYGASECLSIAFSCAEGALHVNADWAIVEAVDAEYRPVPPGTPSHTVLITNLANRTQPIIRYDLGDSVRIAPARCACGSPLPALDVQGRCDEVLTLPARGGGTRRILPMALTTVIEEACDVHRFQVVHDGARTLRLRLPHGTVDARTRAHDAAAAAIRHFLTEQGCERMEVVLDARAPVLDPRTGKLRQVMVER